MLLSLSFGILAHPVTLVAQDSKNTPPKTNEGVSEGEKERIESLRRIVETVANLDADIQQKQKELTGPGSRGRQNEIEEDITSLVRRRDQLAESFTELVTQVDLEALQSSPNTEDFDWHEELTLLLTPLLRELRSLTNRPREMERLRAQQFDIERKLDLYATGIANVEAVEKLAGKAVLSPRLSSIIRDWKERRSELETQLKIVKQKLANREGQRRSLTETFSRLTQLFFRSKGRNLLLAILISALFGVAIRRLHLWLHNLKPFREGRRRFHIRIFEVVFVASSVAGVGATFLIVLYLLGDWVLLTIFLVLLLALLWSSKEALSRFSSQTMLLLNLGPVREGERIIFDGLPWRVRVLHIYSILENPLLTGGVLRIPLQELVGCRSREYDSKEPWFPTREGDWVILNDQTFGKVVLQTFDAVRLVLPGGSFVSYPTSSYLSMNPQVLSTGFRVNVVFGIDYQHQATFTSEARSDMGIFLTEGLKEAGFQDSLNDLQVAIKQAGASSLDFEILADFDGKVANDFLNIRRLLNKLCIDACNQHGWTIPFTQITMHVPGSVQFSPQS